MVSPKFVASIACFALSFSGACKRGTTSSEGTSRERVWTGSAPSCNGLAATCGASKNDDCCRSLLTPGGTYNRSYDGVDHVNASFPATVSDFYLDKFEVTVGRLRKFVDAGMGTQKTPLPEGAGAHPRIAGSGWRSVWN